MPVTGSDIRYAAALKELRKKHKIIQYAMAGHLGLESQQQYSDLEKGKRHFSDELVVRICSFFRISILEFVKHALPSEPVSFLSEKDLKEINEARNSEVKLTLYKKLFLESKIENVENRLKNFQQHEKFSPAGPVKHRIHVII